MGANMRRILFLCAALLGACVHVQEQPAFEAGQVWQLNDPDFPDAQLIIASVEPRGDQMLVLASVVGLPGPPADAVLFEAMRKSAAEEGVGGADMHYMMGGAVEGGGNSMMLSADFIIPAGAEDTRVGVPFIAVLEDDLKASIAAPGGPPADVSEMFNSYSKVWREGETEWPELNDRDLARPFLSRIHALLRAAAAHVEDRAVVAYFAPPPPADAAPEETAIDDPALDEACRSIVSPKPMPPDFIASLLESGVSQEDIPVRDLTLSGISITEDARWGHIWRADVQDNLAPQSPPGRAVCWQSPGEDGPAVTMYPAVPG